MVAKKQDQLTVDAMNDGTRYTVWYMREGVMRVASGVMKRLFLARGERADDDKNHLQQFIALGDKNAKIDTRDITAICKEVGP